MSLFAVRWLLAALHLLALPIGFAAVTIRAIGLRHSPPGPDLRTVFAADSVWGISALLWITTGLVRAFTRLEKGADYYLGNDWFWIKMALLVLILALEIFPMATLIRWRLSVRRGTPIDVARTELISRISVAQAAMLVAMVVAATGMARGFGA